jgi:hypothetical protein
MVHYTLVYSTKNYPFRNVLSYTPGEDAIDKFLNKVVEYSQRKVTTKRLKLRNNHYFYTPSNEYKERFVRFKHI